jgi:hypothetical protein
MRMLGNDLSRSRSLATTPYHNMVHSGLTPASTGQPARLVT